MVDQNSAPEDKIALFRALFRGREDVYPRRFESRKTGRSGYSPACANEWARDLCDKRKVKCAECPNRRLLPVTDEVVRSHLSGQDATGREFVLGVYPMLLDETCCFLAADFDKQSWREDVAAVLETCCQLELPAAMERSRSGHGGHLWLFFQDAIPAALARSLGAHILTETMERRPDIGLDSYDRFFPNQDSLAIRALSSGGSPPWGCLLSSYHCRARYVVIPPTVSCADGLVTDISRRLNSLSGLGFVQRVTQ